MDIEEFYDGDPRRRPSAEIELGTDWRDSQDVHYELNYVEDTGEVYVMHEPQPTESVDPFGGIHVKPFTDAKEHQMTVRVVAHIDTVDNLHTILKGWQEAMVGDRGAEWLAERFRAAGVAVAPGGAIDG
jgi:hypothetical protein